MQHAQHAHAPPCMGSTASQGPPEALMGARHGDGACLEFDDGAPVNAVIIGGADSGLGDTGFGRVLQLSSRAQAESRLTRTDGKEEDASEPMQHSNNGSL